MAAPVALKGGCRKNVCREILLLWKEGGRGRIKEKEASANIFYRILLPALIAGYSRRKKRSRFENGKHLVTDLVHVADDAVVAVVEYRSGCVLVDGDEFLRVNAGDVIDST